MAWRVLRVVLRYAFAAAVFQAVMWVLARPSLASIPQFVGLTVTGGVLLAARVGGLGPGLLVLALFIWATWAPLSDERAIRLAVFVATGGGICLTIHQLLQSRRRLENAAAGRLAAEREARDERDLLEVTLRTTGSLVLVLDPDGRILRFNRACEETSGYRAGEVIGRPFWELFLVEEEVAAIREAFDRLVHIGGGSRREGRWRTRTGPLRTILWSSAAIADEGGATRLVIATGLDLTDARVQEARVAALNDDLSRRVAELQAVLDVIPVGIGIAEDPQCRSIRINAEFARALDLPPAANASLSAPEGQRPTNFRVLREGREQAPEELPLQQAAATGRAVREVEIDIVHADGRVVTLLESAEPLRDEWGRVRGSVGAFLDVTELKRARDSLRQAKEAAEEASRAKDLFLAMLSHELRAPLTPALLAASALLDDPATPGPLRPLLEDVRRGVEAEARLVDDLLDVTRAGLGKLRIRPERLDAHEVIRRALDACAADCESAGVTLERHLDAPRSTVEADPGRLAQVVWNLVKNACKFTPKEGTIRARTCVDSGDRFVLEIADSGAGIEAADLERVFRPFEQTGVGAARPQGLGLGLAIARQIAEGHGGRLTARSDGPGLGSTFVLELPLTEARPPAGLDSPPAEAPRAMDDVAWPSRVLVVEDDAPTAHVMARLLGRKGSEVATVGTIAEALARLDGADATFDLVISDLGLPDGNGHELARALAARGGPPAIALSGYGSDVDLERSRLAGFAEHLTKPITLAGLEAAVLRATTGRGG